MIPIDEQIEAAKDAVNAYSRLKNHGRIAGDDEKLHKFGEVCSPQAILASLQRLKAIESVQVPEEPKIIGLARKAINDGMVAPLNRIMLEHIDTLRDLLRRESARASEWEAEADNQFQYAGRVLEQAHAAEAKLAALNKDK
jgi:hypothetical protein